MELWDVYDINRKKTGKTHLRSVPLPEGSYHLVVHAIIENERGEVLISKRHPTKPYGNLWDVMEDRSLQVKRVCKESSVK